MLTSTAAPISVYFLGAAGEKIYLGSECAGGGCTMVRQAHEASQKLKYPFYYQSLDMAQLSLQARRTFYLEFGGNVDTLVCDGRKNRAPGSLNAAGLGRLYFNGQPVAVDPAQLPVYPLQRRY